MSAGAARATETTRRKYERHCVRPDHVDPNSALPKFGWHAQHALYNSLAIVLKAMYSFKPDELPKGQGRLLRHGSVTKIAERTARFIPGFETSGTAPAMPHRTVAHCLEALAKKGFLVRWDVEKQAPTSPFGTHWRMPRMDEILQRWADDPNIGTIRGATGDKRQFYVIGKGRRFLTPQEVLDWKLDHTIAQRLPSAQATAGDVEEPLTAAEAKSVALGEEIDAVHRALLEVIEIHGDGGRELIDAIDSTDAHAARVIEIARDSVPGMPAEAIAIAVRSIRIDKHAADQHSRKPAFTNVGWIFRGIAAAAHAWRHQQRDRAAG